MTFPIVDRNDPRNWIAPGVDGAYGGPEYYQGRGPVPETIIAPSVYRKDETTVNQRPIHVDVSGFRKGGHL